MNWNEFIERYGTHPGYTEQLTVVRSNEPTRRLTARWSLELQEDLQHMYGINVEEMIMKQWLSETDHFEQHKELFEI